MQIWPQAGICGIIVYIRTAGKALHLSSLLTFQEKLADLSFQ